LAFQKTLDARNRGVDLPVVLQQMDKGHLQLLFLGGEVPSSAQVHLMRPDSKSADVEIELTDLVVINNLETPQDLLPGRWLGRVEWMIDGRRIVKDYTLYLN